MIDKRGMVWGLFLLHALGFLSACGNGVSDSPMYDPKSVVVISSAEVRISTGDAAVTSYRKVIRALEYSENTEGSMTLATDLFVIPTIVPFQVNDFGYLRVSSLSDNKLKVCGSNGKTKCDVAGFRMYTQDKPGAGLWNSESSYGAPITAGQTTLVTVGLGVSGAATMQTITIAGNKNSLSLSDFPNPQYNVKVDFTDAGAGSFSTTIVVEYFLALNT